MIGSFRKLLSFTAFLLAAGASSLSAQKPDHLTINLIFKDSILAIDANYTSAVQGVTDSVYFLLNPEVELDTIIAKGLKSYKIAQKAGIPIPYFLLEFNETIAPNAKLDVDFKYKINLSDQNHMKSNWIELNIDKLWFPNLERLDNEFTYTVTVTDFPESYYVITATDALVTRAPNKLVINKDTPWYEVLLLAGNDMKEWKYDQNITLLGSEKVSDSTFHSIGDKVKNSIDALNGYFGQSDPITSFKVVLRNTRRDELGFQFNRQDLIVTGIDFNDYGNLSHEIAHYWWSKANFINEPWMNESFANYSMYQVLKEFDNENYKRLIARNQELSKNAIPVVNARLFSEDSYTSYYHKGALHLIRLEEKIGADLMKQLLSSCVAKRINTTEAFLTELERLSSTEARTYFEGLLKS